MKGLPCTGKSELAKEIGAWARCPVFYIDDFLHTLSKEKGYNAESLPSPDEAERLHRVAFDELCTAATRHLNFGSSCVVIKSRLSSTFELDRLVELAREFRFWIDRIIIIECQMTNEHRFRLRLDDKGKKYKNEEDWYRPRSWKGIEKVWEECDVDAQANWDLHLPNLLEAGHFGRSDILIRLVLDPFDDLHLIPYELLTLTSSFQHVLKYLLQTTSEDRQENPKLRSGCISSRYMVVQFNDVRRYLVENELQRASERSNYLCANDDSRPERICCVFKYLPEGISPNSKSSIPINCGVCEERLDGVSGQPAYTCYFCFLTLHKSCAQLNGVDSLAVESPLLRIYPLGLVGHEHACKSCIETGKRFSDVCTSCLYQSLLKGRKFPTIIYHESHPEHFLSLEFSSDLKRCDICGGYCGSYSSYQCYICGLYYGAVCISMPLELKDEHGGHKHVMKLMYSHDHEEEEESYWCEVCYRDIDPQQWFYSCQECPYAAHPRCIKYNFREISMSELLLPWRVLRN